ncbi:MAG TPA: (d)CMP kinase, partial [Candidatus Levybacteria bacterium]|nr:(d)CMP kinase [Candidatus Levybacteria bacterium]
ATPEISMAASDFGRNKTFVEFISSELRRLAEKYESTGKGIIMEGRQIGTEVFPDAEVKIFLTANLQTRATRRLAQYQAKGIQKTQEQVINETSMRDEQDMSRESGALPRNPEQLGYEIIDNSDMNEETTLQSILDILKQKKIWPTN